MGDSPAGGDAKDAVEIAVRALETDSTFNASLGATLDVKGKVYLDASMMESKNLRWRGVAAVNRVTHPISVARRILEEKSQFLVAEGAESTTGDGESIIPVVLAKAAVDLLSGAAASMDGVVARHPEAAEQAIEILKQRVPGEAGCILLDRDEGRIVI